MGKKFRDRACEFTKLPAATISDRVRGRVLLLLLSVDDDAADERIVAFIAQLDLLFIQSPVGPYASIEQGDTSRLINNAILDIVPVSFSRRHRGSTQLVDGACSGDSVPWKRAGQLHQDVR